MVGACDESHDRAAVRGKDANKSLHEHMLPRSSGTTQFYKSHRCIDYFGQTVRLNWELGVRPPCVVP